MGERFMMKWMIGAAFCAITLAAGAASASAETLHVTFVETGVTLSWNQDSNPVPNAYFLGAHTFIPITGYSGTAPYGGPYDQINYYYSAQGGYFNLPGNALIVFGPQLYTGFEDHPVFSVGSFDSVANSNGAYGVITFTAVPEPSTWALMLAGFAGLGGLSFVSRRRALAA
jgi:hypothetical protein